MPAAKVKTYQITATTLEPDGTSFSRVLYKTIDQPSFDTICAEIRKSAETKPKTQAPTHGNLRAVRVVDLPPNGVNNRAALARVFQVGEHFPSVMAASEALGLQPRTLRQLFSAARRNNGGVSVPITVRGVTLDYADGREKVFE